MATSSTTHRSSPPAGGARGIILALFLLGVMAWPAVPTPARAAARTQAAHGPAAAPAVAAAPVFANGFNVRKLYGRVEASLKDQRRMLQVMTVGMCLALWIIAWRK